MNLHKATSFIIGGSRGYGKEIATTLLRKGAKVIVADYADIITTNHDHDIYGKDRLKLLKCNISDSKELHNAFDEAKSLYGHLDIICNNTDTAMSSINENRRCNSYDDFIDNDVTDDVILKAVVEGTYKGIQLMSKQNGGNGGVIINVAFVTELLSTSNLTSNLASSNVAKVTHRNLDIIEFSRSFRQVLPYHIHGIRINCFAPYIPRDHCNHDDTSKHYEHLNVVEVGRAHGGLLQCVECDGCNGAVLIGGPHGRTFEVMFDPVINVLPM